MVFWGEGGGAWAGRVWWPEFGFGFGFGVMRCFLCA